MMAVGHKNSSGILLLASAVLGALAAVLFGFSPAQSHTTTATLLPTADGTYTGWSNGFAAVDESGTPACNGSDGIQSAVGARESFVVSLASVPDGATITSVSVQAWHNGQSATGGTFQTFARLGGVDTDSGVDIATTTSGGSNCTGPATQSINVPDTVDSGSTVLEIGVVKTATNAAVVRVGALRATVEYNRAPSTPSLLTPADGATTTDRTPTFDWSDSTDPDAGDTPSYQINRVLRVSGVCNWGSATTNVVSTSTFTPGSDMSLGTHCWRVRAIDHGGLASSFSSERTVTIKTGVNAVITADNKAYDGTTAATYTCDVTGEDAGDTVTCNGNPGTFADKNVGTDKTVTVNGITLGGADASDYVLLNTSDTDEANITKKTLSVDAENASKEYGGADPTFQYSLSGFVSGENAGNAAGLGGSASCTRDAGESVAGSPYEITCAPGTLTATNYDFETGDTADLTIEKATLSIDADDQTKDYGDTDPTFTYTFGGFKNGEDESSAGISGDAACDREPGATVAGSPYTITCESGTLAAANYDFETGDTGELTIEAAEVTAVITAQSKTYDGNTDADYTCEVSGALSGDDVDCDGTHPATFEDANVGENKNVTAINLALSGDDAGNYTLPITTADDQADITKATLSVDAEDATKDYGDVDPTFEYSLSGFVAGEDESTAAGLDGTPSCTRDPGESVVGSPYEITCAPGNLAATNYDFESGDSGDLFVEKADPDCTIDGFSGTYDGNAHGAEGTCEGVNGEGPLAGLDPGDSYTDAPGGPATWNFTDETGNYIDDSDTVQIVINAATLSVNADDKEKDFGELDPPFTYSLSGFIGTEDETSAGVTGDAACDREPGESVAGSPYTITCAPGNLAATNYVFETGDTGELTIGAGAVTAVITAENKTYDGNTEAVYTCEVTGAQSGDDVDCDGDHPASFDDANVGTGKTVTATNLFLTGDDAGNYSLANPTSATDEADITKATVAVDADDQNKGYGDEDPTLTYTLTGFVSGEDEMNVTIGGAGECTRDAGETVDGSPYEITCTPGSLSADNYDFETGETGELVINRATLSVDADDQSKTFGDTDPTVTYTLSGFADGEDETSAGVTGDPDCTRDSGEDVGPYTITCAPGTLTAANYAFETGETGTLTIEGAEVSAEITAVDKEYDGLVDADYSCDVVGEASEDDVTCDGAHPATFDDPNVGTRTATAVELELSGADAGNYTLTNTEDTDDAEITKATLSVDAEDKTKEFGQDDPPLTYTLSGFIAPDDESSVTITGAAECTRDPGETVLGGPYEITCTPGDLEADNYGFTTGETGELTITPDTSVPSVTIEQAEAQDDPTSDSPIVFDVVFSEEVTGFEADDVELSGSAGATTAEVSGEGAAYTVSVSGMTTSGTVIAAVKASAASDGSNDSTASTSTDNTVTYDKPIVDFDPGPTATISGVPRVGDTLTAGEGSPDPEPDSYEYEWFADGNPITGATSKTFSPTNAQVGKAITVKVTAVKVGYNNASDVSDPTGPVGTLPTKSIQVTTNGGAAFAGDRVAVSVLRLQPREAYTVTFDGEVIKTGTANLLGNANFTFLVPLSKQPGSYTVEAVGSLSDRSGTDTLVVKAPNALGVTLSKNPVAAGGTQRVTVTNLLNGEGVEIRYDGTLVSPGSAVGNSAGGYALTFPVGTTTGSHSVEVKGTYNGRTTTKTFTVTGP